MTGARGSMRNNNKKKQLLQTEKLKVSPFFRSMESVVHHPEKSCEIEQELVCIYILYIYMYETIYCIYIYTDVQYYIDMYIYI